MFPLPEEGEQDDRWGAGGGGGRCGEVGALAWSACTEGGTLQPWCLIIAWNLLEPRVTSVTSAGAPHPQPCCRCCPILPVLGRGPSPTTGPAQKDRASCDAPTPQVPATGGGRGAADGDRLPPAVSCVLSWGRGGWASRPRARPGEEAVAAIAVVGNPHWISVGLGVFKREYIYIYIYKKFYTHFIVGFCTFPV